MRLFALLVFVVHAAFEILFGLNAFVTGASSSQSATEIAAQSTQLTIAFRFMGSALFALGVMGVLAIASGVLSVTAHRFAIGFAVFHGVGVIGSLWSAAPTFDVYAATLTLAALIVHASLAIGFVVIALFGRGKDPQ